MSDNDTPTSPWHGDDLLPNYANPWSADNANINYGAAQPTSGGTGHYEIDPDALNDIINQWQQLAHELQKDLDSIESIRQAGPPANDTVASAPQAKAIAQFGQRMHDRNTTMLNYTNNYIAGLKRAQAQYQQQESETQSNLNQQAR